MEIFKKFGVTPTCIKENLERKQKIAEKIKIEQDYIKREVERVQRKQNNNAIKRFENLEENEKADNSINENNKTNNSNENSLQQIKTSVDKPYPQLKDVTPNRKDVKVLKGLAFGRNGELSAILTYLYQHYVLSNDYKDIKDILEKISITEMTHYELLSDAIVAFGGDPTLTDGMGNVWTGRNVSQITDVKQILINNIESEQEAVKQYLMATKTTGNLSLAELYLRIIEDEQLHISIFEELLKNLN